MELPAGLSVSLEYREYTQTYRLFQLLCSYPHLYSCSDGLATILHAGNDRRVTIFLCNCTLPDDGPFRAETCRSLRRKTLW